MKNHKEIDSLKWIRLMTPIHIPRYLVDQVKDRDFSVDRFYKYQEEACIIKEGNSFRINPLNHLWALVNQENEVKGFVWFTIDVLSENICIHTYSIDPDFWFQNKAVGKLADFIKGYMKEAQMKRVFWISKYPKHQQKYGFKPSKHVLMEYTEEEDGKYSTSRVSTGTGRVSGSKEQGPPDGGIRSEEHRSSESSTDECSHSALEPAGVR